MFYINNLSCYIQTEERRIRLTKIMCQCYHNGEMAWGCNWFATQSEMMVFTVANATLFGKHPKICLYARAVVTRPVVFTLYLAQYLRFCNFFWQISSIWNKVLP